MFFFEKKSRSDFYILLFSQTHWSLNRKQRCRNFRSQLPGISPEFSTNQNVWDALDPSALHHWMDSATWTLQNAYKKVKSPFFPVECTRHFSSITSPWDIIYVANNNLKNSLLLHLWEIHNSNPTCLGFSRLENLA